MFKEDKVSNGEISYILEKFWIAFKNKKTSRVTLDDLKKIHNALLKYNDESIFGEVPEQIYIDYKKIKTNAYDKLFFSLLDKAVGTDTNICDSDIKMFDSLGFMLHDRMHAAAYGRFNYTYRAKGERIYWFESGRIGIYNIYAEIDENGFQYLCNDMSSINIGDNVPNGKSENCWLNLGMDYDLNDFLTIISGLVSIRKQYSKDYPLEYLMDPPDVNFLAEFSLVLRDDLWNIVIDLARKAILPENDEYIEAFNYMINIMSKIKINPMPRHIIDFYNSSFDNNKRNKFDEIIEVFKSFGDNKESESFQDSLLYVCRKLQETNIYKDADENDKNSFIAKLLTERCRNFIIRDQTLRGESSNGLTNGEVDICVENKNGNSLIIIEALILKYVDKKYISEHINRVWKYDTSGMDTNYVLVYYQGNNFEGFLKQYIKFLKIADLDNPVTSVRDCAIKYSEIRLTEMNYKRSGKDLKIVHICINMHL
jgi:hypothetical protein